MSAFAPEAPYETPRTLGEQDHLVVIDSRVLIDPTAVSELRRSAVKPFLPIPPGLAATVFEEVDERVEQAASSDPDRHGVLYEDARRFMDFLYGEPGILPVMLGYQDQRSEYVEPDLNFRAAKLQRFPHEVLDAASHPEYVAGLKSGSGPGYQVPATTFREGGILPQRLRSATYITSNRYFANKIAGMTAVDRTVLLPRTNLEKNEALRASAIHPGVLLASSLGEIPMNTTQ